MFHELADFRDIPRFQNDIRISRRQFPSTGLKTGIRGAVPEDVCSKQMTARDVRVPYQIEHDTFENLG